MPLPAPKSETKSIPMPPSIHVKWEWVDPETATKYMERNFDRNRHLRQNWVVTLTESMKSGEFQPTHQGIAFDTEGQLIDGQHRIQAIINSGIGCWLLVSTNVPRNAVTAMDLHAKRKPADQIHIIDETISPTSSDVAIARMMKSGFHTHPGGGNIYLTTTAQVHHFLLEHMEAIRFCQSHATESGTRPAPVRAAIGKAYYHLDHAKLIRFMQVFCTQLADSPREHAAVSFRKWLSDPQNRILARGAGDRGMLLRYTVSAIEAFFKGQVGRSLKAAEIDPWPLPEEE